MDTPIIEFRDFGFQYNAQAEPTLHNIDLTIRKGEKVLIVGPSGCGKSTLAHCMNGLIPFSYRGTSTGTVRVCGTETKNSAANIVTLSIQEYCFTADITPSGKATTRASATESNVTMFTSLDTVRVLLDVLDEITLRISTIDA